MGFRRTTPLFGPQTLEGTTLPQRTETRNVLTDTSPEGPDTEGRQGRLPSASDPPPETQDAPRRNKRLTGQGLGIVYDPVLPRLPASHPCCPGRDSEPKPISSL